MISNMEANITKKLFKKLILKFCFEKKKNELNFYDEWDFSKIILNILSRTKHSLKKKNWIKKYLLTNEKIAKLLTF